MPDALLLAAAVLANVAGAGWLALAMDVHREQVFGAKHAATTASASAGTLRCMGTLGLAASLALCLAVDHGSMAALVWIMALAAAALAIAFTLAWRPRWLTLLVPWAVQRGQS